MNAPNSNGEPKSKSELDRAEREVAKAEAVLSERLHEATALGEATVKRAFSAAKPILIGAAVVGGVVWLVSMMRRPRRSSMGSRERSVGAEIFRAAALSLASVAARRVAERYLSLPESTQSIPARRAGAPQPSYVR
jgi:hypothetical protein